MSVVPLPVRILIGALLALAGALALRSLLAARRARRLERQRRQLQEDVGLLQAALLPTVPEWIGPVRTSAAYRPAEGPGAGGDFYDVFALGDGRVGVIVGDVSGHGRESLPHTALVHFTLRAYLEAGLAPRVALRTAGDVLDRQLGESFVTVAVATYQPRERMLVYATAGHPPPLVVGSGTIEPITVCSAAPIGIGAQTGTRQTVISLPGSSRVCFHTDGITEARVGLDLFGVDRLLGVVEKLGIEASAPALLDSVIEKTDGRPDDMAACLLSIEGGAQAPRVLTEQLLLEGPDVNGRAARYSRACGVEPADSTALTGSAFAEVRRSGIGALLEVSFADGTPSVQLRADNVSSLHGAHVRRVAEASR